jgi:hypothetical protein
LFKKGDGETDFTEQVNLRGRLILIGHEKITPPSPKEAKLPESPA